MQRSLFRLNGFAEQSAVDLLHKIIAQLVQTVDGMLDLGDGGVGRLRVAGRVFLVPQVEVGAMLLHGKHFEEVGCLKCRWGHGREGFIRVPAPGSFIVNASEGRDVEHERISAGRARRAAQSHARRIA